MSEKFEGNDTTEAVVPLSVGHSRRVSPRRESQRYEENLLTPQDLEVLMRRPKDAANETALDGSEAVSAALGGAALLPTSEVNIGDQPGRHSNTSLVDPLGRPRFPLI